MGITYWRYLNLKKRPQTSRYWHTKYQITMMMHLMLRLSLALSLSLYLRHIPYITSFGFIYQHCLVVVEQLDHSMPWSCYTLSRHFLLHLHFQWWMQAEFGLHLVYFIICLKLHFYHILCLDKNLYCKLHTMDVLFIV